MWRRAGDGLEVFWVERARSMAFMGGWYAFPGGGLGRADAGLVIKLFEQEVPEIHEGIVRIVAVARELARPGGDVLAFLPGAREIRRVVEERLDDAIGRLDLAGEGEGGNVEQFCDLLRHDARAHRGHAPGARSGGCAQCLHRAHGTRRHGLRAGDRRHRLRARRHAPRRPGGDLWGGRERCRGGEAPHRRGLGRARAPLRARLPRRPRPRGGPATWRSCR